MKEQRILYNKRYSLLFIALHMKNDSMIHFCVFQVGKEQKSVLVRDPGNCRDNYEKIVELVP